MLLRLAALVFLTASASAQTTPVPASSRQLVFVTTPSWSATTGTLRRYARTGSAWQPVGEPVPVVVGRSGLGWGRGLHAEQRGGPQKREGDGRAPAGVFRLSAAFGYADAEPTGLPYVQARAGTECVDDTSSAYYNQVLDRADVEPDWGSREQMRRRDDLYRIGAIVAHNGPGVPASSEAGQRVASPAPRPGGGSCIFLHVWSGPRSTTSGCTAMADEPLQDVLAWLNAAEDPVMVQLPRAEARRFRRAWGLP
jgi:D-alanyl-D-alanine dipeptidase